MKSVIAYDDKRFLKFFIEFTSACTDRLDLVLVWLT